MQKKFQIFLFGWGVVLLSLMPFSGFAQPRIGIEFSGGSGIGLNSYVDNIVILDADVPVLVDEIPGSGVRFQLGFLFRELELLGALHLYNRNFVVQHHRATSIISPKNSLRPDGTVDDSGVVYTPIPRLKVGSPSNNSGDLVVGKLGGGYRFYLLKEKFSLYIPVVGGLSFITVLEPAKPFRTGLFLESGVGASYLVADPISLFIDGRLSGVASPTYAKISDAARTSALNGESTEATLFSSFLSLSFVVGFQVAIR